MTFMKPKMKLTKRIFQIQLIINFINELDNNHNKNISDIFSSYIIPSYYSYKDYRRYYFREFNIQIIDFLDQIGILYLNDFKEEHRIVLKQLFNNILSKLEREEYEHNQTSSN